MIVTITDIQPKIVDLFGQVITYDVSCLAQVVASDGAIDSTLYTFDVQASHLHHATKDEIIALLSAYLQHEIQLCAQNKEAHPALQSLIGMEFRM